MSRYNFFIIFILSFICFSLKGQPLPKGKRHITGFLEYQTSYREELIALDTIIIGQILHTLNNEGCTNLKYFLQPFQKEKDYIFYPIGFNFAKFKKGFGNKLKKEICKALSREELCIDQLIENIFAPGICSDPGHCRPIYDLIFFDKDPSLISSIKKRVTMKGFRFNYNPFYNVFPETIISTNKKWITLFTPEELSQIDQEQLRYLQNISTN